MESLEEARRLVRRWAEANGASPTTGRWAVERKQPGNVASIAVCRRLGMAELGPTDRYYGTVMELFRTTGA